MTMSGYISSNASALPRWFSIAGRASEQDAVSGAQIVGVQQLCSMLFFHQLLYLRPDSFWQHQTLQVALRRDFVEQVFVRAIAHHLANRRACSLKGTGLQCLWRVARKQPVPLLLLLLDQRFSRFAKGS